MKVPDRVGCGGAGFVAIRLLDAKCGDPFTDQVGESSSPALRARLM